MNPSPPSGNAHGHFEALLWKEIAGRNMSVSHDHWHIDRVLSFARQLSAVYGGDTDVITAAAILHDLGRSDPELHGRASIAASIRESWRILKEVGFPEDRRDLVLLAIEEHDQPLRRPTTIEGRILKDADFLAGFGAWGVLRIALWAGETKGGVGQAQNGLTEKMTRRLLNLEFPESESWAIRESAFAELFLASLNTPPDLSSARHHGKYIVMEGISGSGKDTQANRLRRRLKKAGHSVLKVDEPAKEYKRFRALWERRHSKLDDPVISTFFFMADRYGQITGKVMPALEHGDIVISARSYISTLVYQCDDVLERATATFAHQFVPVPDLAILYDVEPEVAFERIKDRKKVGMFEKRDLLDIHRERYLSIFRSGWLGSRTIILDSNQSAHQVASATWNTVVSSILSAHRDVSLSQ